MVYGAHKRATSRASGTDSATHTSSLLAEQLRETAFCEAGHAELRASDERSVCDGARPALRAGAAWAPAARARMLACATARGVSRQRLATALAYGRSATDRMR